MAILGIVVTSVGLELWYKSVPKWLTIPAALVGVAMNLYFSGLIVGLQSVAGWIVGACAMLAAGRLQPTGKGTVMLLAAVGAFLGVGGVLVAFVFFSLTCGLFMLAMVIKNLVTDVIGPPTVADSGETSDHEQDEEAEVAEGAEQGSDKSGKLATPKIVIPLSPGIAIATALTLFYERQVLALIGLK